MKIGVCVCRHCYHLVVRFISIHPSIRLSYAGLWGWEVITKFVYFYLIPKIILLPSLLNLESVLQQKLNFIMLVGYLQCLT